MGLMFKGGRMKTPEEKAETWCRENDAANCIDVYLAGYLQGADDTLCDVWKRLRDVKSLEADVKKEGEE